MIASKDPRWTLPKSRALIRFSIPLLIWVLAGCSGYAPTITSNPSGAVIFAGSSPQGLLPMHRFTPRPSHRTLLRERCYRVEKPGYIPSGVRCVSTATEQTLHFDLSPAKNNEIKAKESPEIASKREEDPRKVFDLVLLGEPVTELQKRIGHPDKTVGKDLLWAGIGPGRMLSITKHRDEIAAVSAIYEPKSWVTWRNIEGIVRQQYGPPLIQDDLPKNVDGDDSIAGAIYGGRGRMYRSWDRGSFEINLIWERDTLFLRYRDKLLWNQLVEAQRKSY